MTNTNPVKLYHFTSTLHLPHILASGIRRGDVPITPKGEIGESVGVWLTDDKRPEAQEWARPAIPMLEVVYKQDVRLTVTIPPEHLDKLHKWSDYAQKMGVEGFYYDTLNGAGGGGAPNWYVYTAPIPPEWIECRVIKERTYSAKVKALFEAYVNSDEALRLDVERDKLNLTPKQLPAIPLAPKEAPTPEEPAPRGIDFSRATGFKVPEAFRVTEGEWGTTSRDGNNGAFVFTIRTSGATIRCLASDGGGWEHVSVSLPNRTPTWEEMCLVKGVFWGDEDRVMQLHPPKSEYVNHHPYCLHLWRPVGVEIPAPPKAFVGGPQEEETNAS